MHAHLSTRGGENAIVYGNKDPTPGPYIEAKNMTGDYDRRHSSGEEELHIARQGCDTKPIYLIEWHIHYWFLVL